MNLLTIQTLVDGTVVRSFVNYETTEQALSALYTIMASGVVNENVLISLCELIGDNGTVCQLEVYDKTPQPEEAE